MNTSLLNIENAVKSPIPHEIVLGDKVFADNYNT